MRIDKFLKVSRIIKRRVIAKEAIEKGHISINGHKVKPGSQVSIGDQIVLRFASKTLHVEVTSLTERNADGMFQVLNED
jgi:ribosomal 50S subunit-recycling heat shock protein